MPAKPSKSAEFGPVFRELRAILAKYEPTLKVVHDTQDYFYLDTHTIGKNKKPLMFGAVRVMKNYVSFHLMSIYMADQSGISPALKARMQGKACFNFTEVDKALFKELAEITKQGYDGWKKIKWV